MHQGPLPQTQEALSSVDSVSSSNYSLRTESNSTTSRGTAAVTLSIGGADIVDTTGNLIMTTRQVNIHSPTEVTYHNMPVVPPPPLICAVHLHCLTPAFLLW